MFLNTMVAILNVYSYTQQCNCVSDCQFVLYLGHGISFKYWYVHVIFGMYLLVLFVE